MGGEPPAVVVQGAGTDRGNRPPAGVDRKTILNITPSWSQTAVCVSPGCNPTVSDVNLNTAGGTSALQNVVVLGTSQGFDNTAFGYQALQSTTTGHRNTASGAGALTFNTIGSDNIASGTGALFFNTTGNKNTAVGTGALSHSTGNKNIAIGFMGGETLTNGNNNISIGNQGAGDESLTIRIGTAQTGTFIAGIANAGVGNAAATVIIDTTTGQLGIPLSSARYKKDIAPMGTRYHRGALVPPWAGGASDSREGRKCDLVPVI
jgi:hypothetical protein